MIPQAFKKYGLLLPGHCRIGSSRSNGINSETVAVWVQGSSATHLPPKEGRS